MTYITDWLARNKLALNASNTKSMVFHSGKKIVMYPNLLMNDVEIERALIASIFSVCTK